VSALEDVSGRVGRQGAVEPLVELGDVGAGGDLVALVGGHVDPARVDDLENVLGLGLDNAPFEMMIDAFDCLQGCADIDVSVKVSSR
jgi:hypothetical protein